MVALGPTVGRATTGAFVDPIDQPASVSALAEKSQIFALARAGGRLVAAGVRGHILVSDDAGKTWRQSAVPVSVDLVGLSFPTAQQGWAVGHGGVVLHTSDGGLNWQRQLAGLDSSRQAEVHYNASALSPLAASALAQEKQLMQVPRGQPFLDVYFENVTEGFAVGTFNRIFRTVDAGKRWTPWMDRVDNPDQLHFSAIRGRGDRVFLTGERGQVWSLDRTSQRFVSVATPYTGTLFGLQIGAPQQLLAFGMRGSLYQSDDDGHRWNKLQAGGSGAGITAAAELPDGRVVLVDQAGEIRVRGAAPASLVKIIPGPRRMPLFAVVAVNASRIVMGGALGLMTFDLP